MNPTHDQPQTTTQPSSQPHNHSPSSRPYKITPVRTPQDLTSTITLFTAYAASLAIDLSFQDFQTEMSSMPGRYSPLEGGELFLARASPSSPTTDSELGEALGVVALRALPSPSDTPPRKICEMKRLYVSPAARGMGLGLALVTNVIETAIGLGYEEMRLDTLADMVAAQGMYVRLGFVDVEPYCFNPNVGVRFLGLDLGRYRERVEEGGE